MADDHINATASAATSTDKKVRGELPRKDPPHHPDSNSSNKRSDSKSKKPDSPLPNAYDAATHQAHFRFKSPYIFYTLTKQYAVLKELGPGATVNEICRRIASDWHNLSPEGRAPWEEQARLDKERIVGETSHDTSSHGSATLEKPRKEPSTKNKKNEVQKTAAKAFSKKKISTKNELEQKNRLPKQRKKDRKEHKDLNKIPSKPKRPASAYLHFAHKTRPFLKDSNPSMTNLEITKRCAELWNIATPEEKQPYRLLEAKSRADYERAMAEWGRDHDVESAINNIGSDEQQKDHDDEEDKTEREEEVHEVIHFFPHQGAQLSQIPGSTALQQLTTHVLPAHFWGMPIHFGEQNNFHPYFLYQRSPYRDSAM